MAEPTLRTLRTAERLGEDIGRIREVSFVVCRDDLVYLVWFVFCPIYLA